LAGWRAVNRIGLLWPGRRHGFRNKKAAATGLRPLNMTRLRAFSSLFPVRVKKRVKTKD
jgi:hypothetical protein